MEQENWSEVERSQHLTTTQRASVPLSDYKLQRNLFWSCCCILPSARSSSQKTSIYIMLQPLPLGVKFKTEPKPILLLQTETQGTVCTQTLRTFLTQGRRKKERRVKHSSSCSCGLKLWTWRIILEKNQLSSAVQNRVHQELIPDQLVQYTLLMEANTSC